MANELLEVVPDVESMPTTGWFCQTSGNARRRITKNSSTMKSGLTDIEGIYDVTGVPGHTHNASAVISVDANYSAYRQRALNGDMGLRGACPPDRAAHGQIMHRSAMLGIRACFPKIARGTFVNQQGASARSARSSRPRRGWTRSPTPRKDGAGEYPKMRTTQRSQRRGQRWCPTSRMCTLMFGRSPVYK